MPSMPSPILAFDTSGPFCSLAVRSEDGHVTEAYADMSRGQAEALMPMVADMLDKAQVAVSDLAAIGVGTGPGNFTGLRIAVAAARGLALGLARPAIGISAFEVAAAQAGLGPAPVLVSLPAPRGAVYLQRFDRGVPDGPAWIAEAAAPGDPGRITEVVGHDATKIAAALGVAAHRAVAPARPAAWIAALSAKRLNEEGPGPRPAPMYVRPPDAAPPAHPIPVIRP